MMVTNQKNDKELRVAVGHTEWSIKVSGQVYGPMLKNILSKKLSLLFHTDANARETHLKAPQIRLTTPNAPKSAPTHPRTTAGNTPAGINGSGALLKGTKLDVAAPLAPAEPPVPPPVKLAPFGCGNG
jgi:hypothetical protein